MKRYLLLFFILVLNSCTEPFSLKSEFFEEGIVVEAVITNEFKNQEIIISKTFKLNQNNHEYEQNAIVFIKDNLNNIYKFSQQENKYVSIEPFQLIDGRKYKLFIQTSKGLKFQTDDITFNLSKSQIESISYEIISKEGKQGIQFYLNSSDITNKSKYYRIDFEETFKIIAPFWTPYKAIINNNDEIELVRWDSETKICFNTLKNTNLFLANTSKNNNDKLFFPIAFLSKENPKIANRYSINVIQYVLDSNTYSFYEKIKSFSENPNLLNQIQPGLIRGNIYPTNNSTNIIGNLDLCTKVSQRIFVNFSDLFPLSNPKYFFDCQPEELRYCPSKDAPDCKKEIIKSSLNEGSLTYYSGLPPGSITFYPAKCGNCTKLGTNIMPIFWID